MMMMTVIIPQLLTLPELIFVQDTGAKPFTCINSFNSDNNSTRRCFKDEKIKKQRDYFQGEMELEPSDGLITKPILLTIIPVKRVNDSMFTNRRPEILTTTGGHTSYTSLCEIKM